MTPGIYDLGTTPITTSVNGVVITEGTGSHAYKSGLEGMRSCNIDVRFVYGSGGSSAVVVIETSLNQGDTWVEVARLTFATTTREKIVNLVADAENLTPITPGVLSDDTAISGVSGDRWRAKLTTVGTYGGGTGVAVRLHAR